MKQILVVLVVLFLVPLTTSAQDFCEGNFDYDQDQDGTDAVQFKTDFGRHQYNNACPPDGPAPVPKTGQTECWDENGDEILCQTCSIGGGGCTNKTGQDGMWEKGVELPEPRFTVNGDGTVTDNLTGLIWVQNMSCFGIKTWQESLDDCNNLSAGWCGLTDGSSAWDWRLPNIRELLSLIHFVYGISNSAGTGVWSEGDPFTNFQYLAKYWSSTTVHNLNYYAYFLFLTSATFIHLEFKTAEEGRAWCVRGGH